MVEEAFALLTASKLINVVLKVKKWSDAGLLSFIQDINYLKKTQGFQFPAAAKTMNTLESLLQVLRPHNTRTTLMSFLQDKIDELTYS